MTDSVGMVTGAEKGNTSAPGSRDAQLGTFCSVVWKLTKLFQVI